MESTSQRRVRWLARIAFAWSALLLLRLIHLQVYAHRELAGQAEQQQTRIVKVLPTRGAILDRNEWPLAFSRTTDSVAVDPRRIKNVETAISIFTEVLGRKPEELRKLITEHAHRGHLVIQRGVTQAQVRRLLEWQSVVDFIQIYPDSLRHYPEGFVAAHLLGGTNFEQHGYAGLEAALNDDLDGIAGQKLMHVDGRSRGFEAEETLLAEVGASVVTTIDRTIQFEAERILGDALKKCHCEHGSVVVMNPQTGEVYAFAVAPAFDVNKSPEKGEMERIRRNRAVEEPYEPGSVFKMMTVAAAIDMDRVTAETPIPCPANVKVPGRPTPLSNGHGGGGVHPVKEVIAQSSNTGTYYIANRVGKENLYRYVRAFGFGSPTGIELPAETAGRVKPLSKWKQATLAMTAMGYEVSASTIQLAQAGSIIANGGRKMRPTLLRQRVQGARIMNVAQTVNAEQVLRPEAAIAMRRILEWVVVSPHGTGRRAKLDGWSSAGKTGTSRMIEKGKYVKGVHHATFVGFAPVNNPAVVVAVSLHRAHGDSSEVAAPVFREVAMKALHQLGVPQDVPTRAMAEEEKSAAVPADIAADVEYIEEDATEEEAAQPLAVGSIVPDFRGKSMKQVLTQARAAQLDVDVAGAGVARRQVPRAGARLKPGERIQVTFGH